MKKRMLATLLAAALLLGAFAVSASAENTTVVQKWNIVLGDDIGANFYLQVPEATAASVKVTIAGQTQTHVLSEKTSDGLYKVSARVAAARMTEDIILQLVADGVEYAPVSYSIRDYAAQILAGNYAGDVKAVVKHMLNYGAAAQTYFNIHTDKLANAGYQIDYTAQYPAEYVEAAVSGQISGVQAYGATLVLDNKVAVRYYFVADSVEGVTFSANGVNYTAKQKSGMYYVEIPGIAPQDYADAITLTAQKGDEQLQVTYSPMTYMVRMSQKGAAALKTVINAMYGYHEAAVAYLNQPIFSVVKGDWDLSNQHNGSLTITSQKDGTTVITNGANYTAFSVKVKDHTPSRNADGSLKKGDFSAQVYFIFDDGKQYQVRLHNTDADGNYKLQHMGEGNSLTGWKWQADLTTAQKAKLLDGDGVEFAVKLVGANAELWVDGTKMKTVALGAAYDGKPAQIKLCMNGNTGVQNMELPYTLTKASSSAAVIIPAFKNGTVTADKASYMIGDTVTLTATPNSGYFYGSLMVNGESVTPNDSGKYSFVAQEREYLISASFVEGIFQRASDKAACWNLSHQGAGKLVLESRSQPDYSWLKALSYGNDITTTVTDHTPSAKDFSMIYQFKFANGEVLCMRLNHTDNDDKYRIQVMSGSTLSAQWKNHYALNDAQTARVQGDGIIFRVAIVGTSAEVYLDGTKVCAIDLSKVVATGAPSGIAGIPVLVELRMDGNLNKTLTIPFTLVNTAADGEFKTVELSKYVIVYDSSNSDYMQYANQLKAQISAKYGVDLPVVYDTAAAAADYEILIGDTNRYSQQGRVMEYSVTVSDGHFKINVGGSCSAEKAIAYLCENVFTGQAFSLANGEYFQTSLLTNSRAVTNGATVRVMSANILADAFSDGSYKNANYRAEILAGMLVSYTPDVVGMQEMDASWNRTIGSYLAKIEKTHGIKYSQYWATYEGKTNYSSFLYRADKLQVKNSGVQVFSWWKDLGANYRYHMRNISWAQFSVLGSGKKFVVANTHWSYRTEHADGNTYLTGSTTPIATDELRTQCKNETNTFMSSLKTTYSDCPVFLTGDFNTSLPYFTQWGWAPTSYGVISEQAKNNGTALSTVPTSGHYDHIFGTGSYTVKCYELIKDANQHSALTDHPFVYVDLAF